MKGNSRIFPRLRARAWLCELRVRSSRIDEEILPFKINSDLYTSWQMATESSTEINKSAVFEEGKIINISICCTAGVFTRYARAFLSGETDGNNSEQYERV